MPKNIKILIVVLICMLDVKAYEGELHKLLVGRQSSTDLSVEYESPKRKFHASYKSQS